MISHQDRTGNGLADTWAGKGAEINQMSPNSKSVRSWIDASTWLIQQRMMACVQLYIPKEDHVKTEAKIRRNRYTIFEELGHIPRQDLGSKWWTCCLCGSWWQDHNTRAVKGQGKCLGATSWGPPPPLPTMAWILRKGSMLHFNGRAVHPTHHLAWMRGILYCIKCGAYSVTRLIKLGAPCRLKVLDVTTTRRLNNIRAGKFPVKGKSWPMQEHENVPAFIAGHLQ